MCRDADRFDRHIDAETVGEREDLLFPVGCARVDRVRSAEIGCACEPRIVEVECDDLRRAVEASRHDGREPDGAGADDGDDITGLDRAVLNADLEAGRQDVGEDDPLGIGDALGHLVERVLGERDANVLRLGAVDHVSEDPADAGDALRVEAVAVQALAAVRARVRTS